MVKRLLREFVRMVMEDTAQSKEYDPSHWGLEDSDVSRKTLRIFLEKYSQPLVDPDNSARETTVARHVMFVDDMEGVGLREALEEGDMQVVDIIVNEIMQAHPFGDYDPFGNNFSGSGPKLSSDQN